MTVPLPVTIRPETSADREAVHRVNTEAFGRPAEADLVDALRPSPEFIPELSLVAERDGEIIGHVLLSHVTVEGVRGKMLALGPIAVAPAYQKQGVGGTLIGAAAERAAAAGYQGIVLIGHTSYYPRFGFVPASRFGLRSTFGVPDDVFMALPLRPGGLDDLSGTVRFAPAFDGV